MDRMIFIILWDKNNNEIYQIPMKDLDAIHLNVIVHKKKVYIHMHSSIRPTGSNMIFCEALNQTVYFTEEQENK